MPANTVWKEEHGDHSDVGMLFEIQVVACGGEEMSLGQCWWPLTSAHISRSMQVITVTVVILTQN